MKIPGFLCTKMLVYLRVYLNTCVITYYVVALAPLSLHRKAESVQRAPESQVHMWSAHYRHIGADITTSCYSTGRVERAWVQRFLENS